MAKKVGIDKRLYADKHDNDAYRLKLIKLMDASGWNYKMHYMGELLLSEIRKSTDTHNEHLRERAKMLGLMEW